MMGKIIVVYSQNQFKKSNSLPLIEGDLWL